MNRTILNKALKTLKDRKTSAERIADANYKVALENKDFENIDKLMRSLTIEISKKEFWGKDSKIETEKLKSLEKQRQEILEKNFGKDFSIAPHYSCSKCHDTGFDGNEPCSCLKEIITSILLNLSGTARNLATFDNANFDLFEEGYREKIKLAYQKMEEWCEKFKTTKYKNIGLFGNTGVGKTFLTEAMANKLMSLGNVIMFTSSFNLGNTLMNYHKAIDEAKQSIIAPYLDCDVLIIDDLGEDERDERCRKTGQRRDTEDDGQPVVDDEQLDHQGRASDDPDQGLDRIAQHLQLAHGAEADDQPQRQSEQKGEREELDGDG